MKILGNRRPKSVTEYFTWLYCKRKKLQWGVKGTKVHSQALRSWKTLTSAEREVFINKYNKWQAKNDKKVASILQYAEPFMKKKPTREHITETRDSTDGNQIELTINSSQVTTTTDDNLPNADSEFIKQENIDLETHITATKDDYDDDQMEQTIDSTQMTPHIDDNLSNAGSEITNQIYAALVIDTDIDETPSEQKINVTVESEKLTEPIRPAVKNGRDLFETLKCSGTRPELATLQWEGMNRTEKVKYMSAVTSMRRKYLIQYEQYLQSLSSPELFKHYIKTLKS